MAKGQIRRYPAQLLASLRRGGKGASRRDARGAKGGEAGEGAGIGEAVLPDADIGARWLGHATVMIEMPGSAPPRGRGAGGADVGRSVVRIITDPVLSERVGPRVARRTIGVARRDGAPRVDAAGVDIVLVSHAHYDHLDRPSLKALAGPGRVVVTARGTRGLIPRGFARVIELDWHESVDVCGVTITAYRPKHWGARTVWDRHRGYNSYLIESARLPGAGTGAGGGGGSGAAARAVARVFFAGDTAYTRAFDGIEATLAIFGIGAYEPWIHAHANPEQVWAMFRAMRADYLMPIHHETFPLGDERPGEPMARLVAAAGDGVGRIVGVPGVGAG